MNRQVSLAATFVGALVFAGCTDTSPQQSLTGVPSLNTSGSPGSTHCEGTLPPGVYEKILVLPGATCFLSNSVITRDVTALPRSSLVMVDNQVGGSIESHNATQVIVRRGTVAGSVRIKGGGFPGVAASVNEVTVTGGDISVENVFSNIIFVGSNQVTNGGILASRNESLSDFQMQFNTVARDIEVYRNIGPGVKIVSLNASQAVRCEGNAQPFIGGPNFAAAREGQCF
jgi:hypothetical protein